MAGRALGDHHLRHLVCTACRQLRSVDRDPDEIFSDTCRCLHSDVDHTHREALVPCRICAGCGLAIAPGHTRWRQNFCAPCRSDFVDLRAMLGWSHIPLGLHSLVNQSTTLATERLTEIASSPQARQLLDRSATQFASGFANMVRGIDHLYTHVDRLTGERLVALGFTDDPTVGWGDYLTACSDAGITDDDGWTALLQAFDLAEWTDDVQAFRHRRT